MEPRSVAENGVDSNSSPRLFPHGCQLQGLQSTEGPRTGLGKFWDGQWPSLSNDWAEFNSKTQVIERNFVQGCDSPLASDSSSSLSTRESSFFSWSEGSCSAAKHMLHSPELLSSRFVGFSLFNSGVNQLESVCREICQGEELASRDKEQDGCTLLQSDMLHKLVEPEQSNCDPNTCNLRLSDVEHGRDQFTKEGESHAVKDLLDGDWVSDNSDSGASATSLSQEIQRRPSCGEADDMHRSRFQREWKHPVYERSSQFHVNRNLGLGDVACINQAHRLDLTIELPVVKDSSTNVADACSSMLYTHPYKETSFSGGGVLCDSSLLENNDGYRAHSAKDFTHRSLMELKESYAAPHKHSISKFLPDEWNIGYIKGLGGSVRTGNIGTLHVADKHSRRNGDPSSVHLVDARELCSRRKACLSAAVKERFASSTLHGYLRCAEQGDSPCYSFSLDDSDEVLFARASRQERKSNKENCEWTYSFHSKKDIVKAKGAWKPCSKENLASDLVANLRVSSGVCSRKAKSNQDGQTKEARFVLYDSGGQHQVGSQGAGSTSKIRGQPLTPVLDNTSRLQAEVKEGMEPCLNPDAKTGVVKRTVCHPIVTKNRNSRLDAGNEAGPKVSSEAKFKPGHSRQAELAAIIISTSAKEKKINKKKESLASVKDAAGWGMKFLDKGTGGWGINYTEKSLSNSRGLEEMASCKSSGRCELPGCCIGDLSRGAVCRRHLVKPRDDQDTFPNCGPDLAQNLGKKTNLKKSRLKVDVTVILPAGDHGLPDEDEEVGNGAPGSHGPTPLLERWMSGGDCECGGWDMGCGLSVFKAETLTLGRKTANIALTRNDRMNWISAGSPFKLFTQDYKHKKVLVLEIIEAGFFSMSFQARLSPLQAFAVAVAIFHQQMTLK